MDDLILSINGALRDICVQTGQTVARVEEIGKDVKEIVQRHDQLCTRVEALEQYVNSQKVGVRTSMIILGIVSGLIGAMAGAASIVAVLYQIGSMIGGP